MQANKPFVKDTNRRYEIAEGESRLALCVEYDGRHFNGYQIQRGRTDRTVQGQLEIALSAIANHPVNSHCTGRTDTGVHATRQIVHFDTPSVRPVKAWVEGVNNLLPDDVAVRWATPVDERFHARHSALARTYRYLISTAATRPTHTAGLATWARRPLNLDAMNAACQKLLGEQDFSSFRGAGCQSVSPMRNVTAAHFSRQGPFVVFEVTANAFLLHMVRNFVGSLMAVGFGQRDPQWIGELIQLKDRNKAGVTAKPEGLYLVDVEYPSWVSLPRGPIGPFHLT